MATAITIIYGSLYSIERLERMAASNEAYALRQRFVKELTILSFPAIYQHPLSPILLPRTFTHLILMGCWTGRSQSVYSFMMVARISFKWKLYVFLT